MFKTKVINYTFFLVIFTLLSACGGASSNSDSPPSTDLVEEEEEEEFIPIPFRSTWKIPEGGETITLPLVEGYKYDFTVDWGDGSPISEITSWDDMDKTHEYTEGKEYELEINGLLQAWSFQKAVDTEDKMRIVSVEDFGHLGYKNLSGAFRDCSNLVAFKGGNTSRVTDMSFMFDYAQQVTFDVSVGGWDVSKVTNMEAMFTGVTGLNTDVSGWDVSSVTNMAAMFDGATDLNIDVSKWNVSSVTNMAGMFAGATDLNNIDVSKWDVSSVTNMVSMFSYTTDLNIDVSKWNVSSVTNMANMFSHTTDLNIDVSKWDVSKVTNMKDMFHKATNANPNVSEWNVSSVTNMEAMFREATSANPNVTNWNVSSVTNMEDMFREATSAEPETGLWDVSKVTNMKGMFREAPSANPDVTNWNVSSVTSMLAMFSSATSANPNVTEWNVSSVTHMGSMFSNTSANPDVSKWDVSSVNRTSAMFRDATNANPNVTEWNVSSVTNMRDMFLNATSANPNMSNWVLNTDALGIILENMFSNSGLSTANYDAFLINLADNNASVENVTLGAFGVYYSSDDAKTARETLANDRSWTITDGGDYAAVFRSTWKVPADSKTITLPLVSGHNYNFTVNWGDGSSSEITAHDGSDKTHTYEDPGDYNLVIGGLLEAWSFNDAGDKNKILSVENFGNLGYKNLSGAFHGCTNLSSFEGGVTSDVTDMASMFEGATSANPNVSNWDVSKVTDMTNMFNGATAADPDVSGWVVSAVTGTGMTNLFKDSGLSTENYDAFLINLAANNALVENVTLGALGVYYSSDDAKTARDTLLGRGWTITDAGDITP